MKIQGPVRLKAAFRRFNTACEWSCWTLKKYIQVKMPYSGIVKGLQNSFETFQKNLNNIKHLWHLLKSAIWQHGNS